MEWMTTEYLNLAVLGLETNKIILNYFWSNKTGNVRIT
jgi:hypothetical protein